MGSIRTSFTTESKAEVLGMAIGPLRLLNDQIASLSFSYDAVAVFCFCVRCVARESHEREDDGNLKSQRRKRLDVTEERRARITLARIPTVD